MNSVANTLLESLARAVEAQPDDVALRLHLATLLLEEGRPGDSIRHCALVLQREPDNTHAHRLLATAAGLGDAPSVDDDSPEGADDPATEELPGDGFDWDYAAQQMQDTSAPRFVEDLAAAEQVATPAPSEDMWDIEMSGVTLADVGGMESVKERLDVSFLAPMRNPELRQLYGKSLRGGLLLYGPPGCGKTYIARAVAGEMGAGFMNVTLSDILDKFLGESEHNLHDLFQLARRNTPMVLFLDELDAVGHKRTRNSSQHLRNVVNQLLQELDGVGSNNEGVYVLAATNAPWDIDPALRRPGRLDRSVAVLPPDLPARAAIVRHDLTQRPVEGIDVDRLARDTDGFTGADLAHLCESAAELALMDSVRTGRPRRITMKDLITARKQIKPSARTWFDAARNVVVYADAANEYAELTDYMKRNKLL